MSLRSVTLLGSTGSIGTQAIDVISRHSDRFRVDAISAGGANAELLAQQAVALGLADQLGNIDYVAREVVKAEEVIDYTRRDNVAERLAKRFGAAFGDASVRALRTAPALR